MHYWRHHARVARRLWSDIPQRLRDTIAADAEHTTEEYKWFAAKVDADSTRLYEDPLHWDNQEFTFQCSAYEQLEMAA